MTTTEPSRIPDQPDSFDWSWTSEKSDWVPPALKPAAVSSSRIYDYLLGGKDNFEPDRVAAEQLLRAAPYARAMARGNREFLVRAVRYLVRDCGIKQIIDLGTGLPTSPSVHEIARQEDPDVRVVYVDNDPLVAAHNTALLGAEPNIVTLLRDLREPDSVLNDTAVRSLIDFERPVGLLFVAVLHFVSIDLAPVVIARFRDAVPPASGLAISAVCRELSDPGALKLSEELYRKSDSPLYARSIAQVEQLFEGFRLPIPLAPVLQWGVEPGGPPPTDDIPMGGLGGVGLKN